MLTYQITTSIILFSFFLFFFFFLANIEYTEKKNVHVYVHSDSNVLLFINRINKKNKKKLILKLILIPQKSFKLAQMKHTLIEYLIACGIYGTDK